MQTYLYHQLQMMVFYISMYGAIINVDGISLADIELDFEIKDDTQY